MAEVRAVNYDEVAPKYDERWLLSEARPTARALRQLAEQVNARRILDVGCGTGQSLRGIVPPAGPARTCYGLDVSWGMLREARELDAGYRLVQASAVAPPFVRSSFDLVFSLNAIHHFLDKTAAVREACSLVKPGGVFAIITFDPRECRDTFYLYDYFDGVYETDLWRFKPIPQLEGMLLAEGLIDVRSPVVWDIDLITRGRDILQDYFLRKDASSQLLLLSDAAYQEGVRRIRAALDSADASRKELTFRNAVQMRMVHGFKPPGPVTGSVL